MEEIKVDLQYNHKLSQDIACIRKERVAAIETVLAKYDATIPEPIELFLIHFHASLPDEFMQLDEAEFVLANDDTTIFDLCYMANVPYGEATLFTREQGLKVRELLGDVGTSAFDLINVRKYAKRRLYDMGMPSIGEVREDVKTLQSNTTVSHPVVDIEQANELRDQITSFMGVSPSLLGKGNTTPRNYVVKIWGIHATDETNCYLKLASDEVTPLSMPSHGEGSSYNMDVPIEQATIFDDVSIWKVMELLNHNPNHFLVIDVTDKVAYVQSYDNPTTAKPVCTNSDTTYIIKIMGVPEPNCYLNLHHSLAFDMDEPYNMVYDSPLADATILTPANIAQVCTKLSARYVNYTVMVQTKDEPRPLSEATYVIKLDNYEMPNSYLQLPQWVVDDLSQLFEKDFTLNHIIYNMGLEDATIFDDSNVTQICKLLKGYTAINYHVVQTN